MKIVMLGVFEYATEELIGCKELGVIREEFTTDPEGLEEEVLSAMFSDLKAIIQDGATTRKYIRWS